MPRTVLDKATEILKENGIDKNGTHNCVCNLSTCNDA